MMISALMLVALAGGAMLWNLEVRAVQDTEARARAAGAHFAQWFRAAHHLTQSEEAHYRNLVTMHGALPLPSDSLKGAGLVPAWISTRSDTGQTITLGVLNDGHGVPMAFALATPTRPLSPFFLEGFVAGAAANRVGEVAGPGRPSRATRWRGAIERVLGRALQRGELYATADVGIAHDRRVLYRREQPGRAGVARMGTSLYFAEGAGISDVGDLDALRAEVTGDLTVGALDAQGNLIAQSANVSGAVRTQNAHGQDVEVRASLDASSLGTGELTARNLLIETELASRTAHASGAVTAPGDFATNEVLEASGAWSDALMSERLEAWGASGRLEAGGSVAAYHSVGERARFDGRVTVTGRCSGC